jgi:hypothetical protein
VEREAAFYRGAERRIERLTLILGAASALAVLSRYGSRAAAGVALGAVISWLNFRLLKQGVGAALESFGRQMAPQQAGGQGETAEPVRLPKRLFLRLLGGFVLLLVALYAILAGSVLPGAAVLAGLFTLVAAVLVELLIQLFLGE